MKNNDYNRSLLSAACILALPFLAAPAPAPAQQANSNEVEQSSNDGLQEIVVTAERRSQSVLTVPMSISATSGPDLEKNGIRNYTDLELITPGLYNSDGGGFTQLYIRGVGNNLLVGADPSVALFIDDVPRIYGQLFNEFADVQRVEVLKGAQGGLYGRNATGGVINVVTRQPDTEKMEGEALVSYGEKNTLQSSLFVNIPVSDRVAFSVAFERDHHNDYIENIAIVNPYTAAMFPKGSYIGTPQQTASFFNSGVHPPEGSGNQDMWSADAKLLVKLSDSFKITLAYDYNQKADTTGDQHYDVTPAYALNVVQNGFFGGAGIYAQLPPSLGISGNGAFTTSKAVPTAINIRDYGGSATAVWNLPGVDLTSISAYRGNVAENFPDISDLPVPTIEVDSAYRRHFFYQELRGISTGTGPFHFLGGASYLTDWVHSHSDLDELPPLVVNVTNGASTDNVHNWSVYGQVGYDLTQALNLTASGRIIHETNRSSFEVPAGEGITTAEHKFVPSATLSYKLDGGGVAYARFAEGFKTGGINPFSPPSFFPTGSQGSVFGGETVYTYEVGYRAPFLDNKVQLTSAIFYNDYKNLQIVAHTTPAYADILEAIVNGGNARTWGAEETLAWRVISPVTLGINAAYLNAKYKDFDFPGNAVLEPFDLTGTQMLNSPSVQLSLIGNVDQPLNDKLNLIGNVVASRTSSVIFEQSGLPGVLPPAMQSGYWLTNLRLGVRTVDDRYQFAVSVSNLFNQAYTTFGYSQASSGTEIQWGNPRIVRGEVVANFDAADPLKVRIVFLS